MTISELAKEIGAEVLGDGAANITSAATLEDAQAGQVSFLANPKYAKQLETTGASAGVGRDCILYANAVVYDDCVLGDRVIVHSCSVVGADGYGFATHKGEHHKIPQVGNVIVEDDVEIGSCCSIERAAVGNTVI